MAKSKTQSTSSSLSSSELDDLKTLGYVEGNASTIPDNISPVLKSKILEGINKENGNVNSQDLGSATERQNQLVRERAAADGDEDMAKLLETQQADAQKVQEQKAQESAAQADAPVSTQTAPKASSANRQNKLNS